MSRPSGSLLSRPSGPQFTKAVTEAGKVDQILMCGGSSLSNHLRNAIRELYDPIPVRLPTPQAGGSRTVAMGAILLLEDKGFIQERMIRHGFCVAWFKPISELRGRRFPDEYVEENEVDHIDRVNVSKFFFHAGSLLPLQYEAPHVRGYRQLRMKDLTEDDNGLGWDIVETLYYCEKPSDDDLAVEDDSNAIEEMPMTLTYRIPYHHAQKYWGVEEYDCEDCYEIEYEVILFLDGERMRFEILIPRLGKFDKKTHNPREDIRIEVKFNIAGLFDLVNLE